MSRVLTDSLVSAGSQPADGVVPRDRPLALHLRWKRDALARADTTPARELVAGLTTFGAVSYVIVVNPAIVSGAGPDFHALLIVTVLSSMLGTLIMALLADLPIALAPGMGANVVFAQAIVVRMGVPYQTALVMVLIGGALFLVLAVTRWRARIIQGFPRPVLIGLQAGVGFFIAYLGMLNGGLVVNTVHGPEFGSLRDPVVLLVLAGVLLTPILMAVRIPGAFLLSIALMAIAGLFVHHIGGKLVTVPPAQYFDMPSLPYNLFLDFDVSNYFHNFFKLLPITLYFFISDFFAASSTLISVMRLGHMEDEHGNIFYERRAYAADALSTIVGAGLGSSTVMAYVESAAGVEAGGRTGLSALVVAGLFGVTLFFSPLISVIPLEATAPVLVLVGILMLDVVRTIDPSTPEAMIPPCLMMLVTVVTTDLMMSLCLGCFSYTLIVIGRRRFEALTAMLIGLDAVLLLYLILMDAVI